MSDIPNERLREIVDKTYCLLDEGESMARELLAARAEVERLRSRVGWLDHLDTPEGRAMHATEAVQVDNEQLLADMRKTIKLIGDAWACQESDDWRNEAWELIEKYRNTL